MIFASSLFIQDVDFFTGPAKLVLQAVQDSGGRFGMTGELQKLMGGRMVVWGFISHFAFFGAEYQLGTKFRSVLGLRWVLCIEPALPPSLPPCQKEASYVSTLRSVPSVLVTPVLADIACEAPPL